MARKKPDDRFYITILGMVGVAAGLVMINVVGAKIIDINIAAGYSLVWTVVFIISINLGFILVLLLMLRSAIKIWKEPPKERVFDW